MKFDDNAVRCVRWLLLHFSGALSRAVIRWIANDGNAEAADAQPELSLLPECQPTLLTPRTFTTHTSAPPRPQPQRTANRWSWGEEHSLVEEEERTTHGPGCRDCKPPSGWRSKRKMMMGTGRVSQRRISLSCKSIAVRRWLTFQEVQQSTEQFSR